MEITARKMSAGKSDLNAMRYHRMTWRWSEPRPLSRVNFRPFFDVREAHESSLPSRSFMRILPNASHPPSRVSKTLAYPSSPAAATRIAVG